MGKNKEQLPAAPKTKHPTRKKIKYVGTEEYINMRTGELQKFAVEGIEERDFNFTKVWFEHLLASYDLIGNQKTKVANYIIDNLNRDNLLLCTYRGISQETGVSIPTVNETMQILLKVNFLQKVQSGCYRVNPDVLFKGTAKQRLGILQQYQEEGYEPPKLSKDEQIKQYQKAIQELQRQIDRLQGEEKYDIDAQIDGQMELMPDGTIVERANDRRKKHHE